MFGRERIKINIDNGGETTQRPLRRSEDGKVTEKGTIPLNLSSVWLPLVLI